jgi:hypothetical protein
MVTKRAGVAGALVIVGTLLWGATGAGAQPVANAGPDQTVFVGATVALNGSASTPPGVSFAWSLQSRAKGSAAVLAGAATATPSFTVDKPGTYVVRLVVSAGGVSSAPDTVTIVTQNRPPVANAGPPVAVAVGKKAAPDGSASSDPDGDKLTYAWRLVGAPPSARGTVDKAEKSKASIVLDRPGTYVAEVTVSDGVLSATDTVTLTTINATPKANAGPDQSAAVGQVVQLDGSASSDVDEDVLSFAWTVKAAAKGSTAAIIGASGVRPTFTPDVAGNYTLELSVSDGALTKTDTVVVTTNNVKPAAAAGPDQRPITVGVPVRLDGSAASDADGPSLTYAWTLKGPAGSAATLSDPTAVRPTFTPDLAGAYSAKLTVGDGTASGAPDTVKFVTKNVLPVSNAGADQLVTVGAVVTLDGSGSTDLDGQRLTYGWAWLTRPAGSAAAFSHVAAVRPTFTADVPGTYVAQLIVFDGLNIGAADTVTVTTESLGPVAWAGHDRAVATGATVNLDGSGSVDPAGGALTYAWRLLARPATSAAALAAATTATPSFVADKAGDYVVQLTVRDGAGRTARDTVLVSTGNLAPRASAGADQVVTVGATVTLSGAGTVDPNGGTPSYAWALVAWPEGSAAALSSAMTVGTTFVADEAGEYVVQLIARDASLASAPDTIYIRASAGVPPVAHAGPDQAKTMGSLVTLDGSGSFDPDGAAITYAWSVVSEPAGSAIVLAGATTVAPTFTPAVAGSYVIRLIVNDGTADSAPDTVTVTVTGGGSVTATPNPLAFSATQVGSSRSANVFVTNTGGTTVSVGVPSIAGDAAFTTSATGCPSVSPGNSCVIGVMFAPASAGAKTGTLNIPTSVGPQTVTLTGTGQAPSASISPNPLAFASTQVGSSRVQNVFVTNTGVGSISVSAPAVSGDASFTTGGTGCPSLSPGNNCVFTVTFAPASVGAKAASWTFTTSVGDLVLSLTGAGQAPSASISPNPASFSATQVGSTRVQNVFVTNTGVGSIAVSAPAVSGDASFTTSGSGCPSVSPGNNCVFTVTFAPTSVGAKAASWTFTTSGGDLVLSLTGTGQAPSASISPNPAVFSATQVGSTRVQNVFVTNTGVGSIAVSAPAVSGDASFTTSGSGCPSVSPGNNCVFTVTFAPTSVGAKAASWTFTTSGGDLVLSLTGTGQAPSASISPNPVTFGVTVVGSSRQQNVFVTNTGVGNISVSAPAVSGDASFTTTGTGCPSVSPGNNCVFSVTFAPTSTGAKAGSWTFTTTAGDRVLLLQGTGT